MSRTGQPRNRPVQEEHYTPAEVAALFRVDPKTVTRWAQRGWLPSVRTLGGHRRYSKDRVQRLLRDGLPAEELEDQELGGEMEDEPTAAVSAAEQDGGVGEPVPGPVPGDVAGSVAARDPIGALIEDHFGGDAVAALLEVAGRYDIGVAYLDRAWFTRHLGRALSEAEWNRVAAELNDFCAVLDEMCAGDLAAYADLVLHAARVVVLDEHLDSLLPSTRLTPEGCGTTQDPRPALARLPPPQVPTATSTTTPDQPPHPIRHPGRPDAPEVPL